MEGEEASILHLCTFSPKIQVASACPFPVTFQREALGFLNYQQMPLATDIPTQNSLSCSPLLLGLLWWLRQ